MIEVNGYTQYGSIDATIDGVSYMIPDDLGNRHRQMIAEWEAEGNIIPPYIPSPPTSQEVETERNRRLALGFDYDFGDERGVHRIATTPKDMVGWDEVTKLASALLATGQSTPITIATGTGVTQVTPMEWQQVMLAAAQFRQPIWGASFVLEEMDPIPANFTDDIYW